MSALGRAGRRAAGDPNAMALLGLKLLLLAFFILLNALASYEEERTRQVIESLRDTFRGELAAAQRRPRVDAALGPLQAGRGPVERVARLFRQSVPAVRVEAEQPGRLLRVSLPAAAMFRAGREGLRGDRAGLLARIAAGLRRHAAAGELSFLHTTAAPAATVLDARALAVRRAGLFARRMQRLGLPERMLSVGLVPAAPGAAARVVVEVRLDGPAGRRAE